MEHNMWHCGTTRRLDTHQKDSLLKVGVNTSASDDTKARLDFLQQRDPLSMTPGAPISLETLGVFVGMEGM